MSKTWRSKISKASNFVERVVTQYMYETGIHAQKGTANGYNEDSVFAVTGFHSKHIANYYGRKDQYMKKTYSL